MNKDAIKRFQLFIQLLEEDNADSSFIEFCLCKPLPSKKTFLPTQPYDI